VILASDGDTRVGESRRGDAVRLIDEQTRVGIVLSAVGFGVRNIRESMLESIAHPGSGELAFVDTPGDARRALSDRVSGGFTTVARDVRLQVEFNPARVASWRLIGYEDRVFLREDFDPESLAGKKIDSSVAFRLRQMGAALDRRASQEIQRGNASFVE
jgi:Ca-activated chloride channel family protein